MEKLNFIGVGGATNLELGGNCCFLKNNDNLLIIDVCEEATKKLLKAKAFKDIKDIYIIITHTHYDHIAGLGVLIWYINSYLKKTPKIIYSDKKYKKTLEELLRITGVEKELFEFVHEKSTDFNFIINMMQTTHTSMLQCFGIMFKYPDGKCYYTGDTNDINYIKKLNDDSTVKRIYCEVRSKPSMEHIYYNDIKGLNKNKLVLMHFNTTELYKQAIEDGFKTASLIEGEQL